jgi:hypothetical protein
MDASDNNAKGRGPKSDEDCRRQFAQYLQRYGPVHGSEYYLAGLTFRQADGRYIDVLQGQLAAWKQRCQSQQDEIEKLRQQLAGLQRPVNIRAVGEPHIAGNAKVGALTWDRPPAE